MPEYEVILVAVAAVALAAAGTRGMIGWAHRRNLIDTPNHRSSHTRPTPRGGGLAIVAAFYAGALALWWTAAMPGRMLAALFCALPIAVVGYLDDAYTLSARLRLLVHAACAGLLLALLAPLPALSILGWTVPPTAAAALYLLGLVWLTNLYNFMDGIDGIAASQAVAIGLLWWLAGRGPGAAAALIFAAAALGFLFHNYPPARIFMGDVGSGFCGFLAGALVLMLADGTATPAPLWLVPLTPFICDATVTLLVRLARRQRLSEAHRSHVYQRLARRLGGHLPVSAGFFLLTLVPAGGLFLWAAQQPQERAGGALLAAAFVLGLAALCLRAGRDD